jgi:23S rRNA pseudouridine1911/1915/1917 synthase
MPETSVGADAAGVRLDRFLAGREEVGTRARAERLIEGGDVLVDGVARPKSHRLAAGSVVVFPEPAPTEIDLEPAAIDVDVVWEDEHLMVVDKPAGLVVHPAAGNRDGTLVNALLHHCGGSLSGIGGVARPGIVHRIDKDTSGLLVVAKTDVAHEGLSKQFATHSIDRRYLAIVNGVPKVAAGTVDAPLARSSANRKKIAIVEDGRGKRAVTHWKRLEVLKGAALVECRLETGRTHQVRVHLASIGHALLGDPVYGRGKSVHRQLLNQLDFHRQALHAAGLGFTHPVTKARLSFESALPSDMQELFTALRV